LNGEVEFKYREQGKEQRTITSKRQGVSMMVDTNPSDAVNPLSTRPNAETQEFLLADLVGAENADPIFEGLIDGDEEISTLPGRLRTPPNVGVGVTGGDMDDDWYQAEVVGEEAVGGQNPTPDQNVTEDLLQAMGIVSTDADPVQTLENFRQRDRKRWELDPESSEDYQEHGE
jgi:hypothetical protein